MIRYRYIFQRIMNGIILMNKQKWAPRGFGDLGRMAVYFQGAGEHW